ncbi:MAG: thioesterase family protein [Marinobacter sp.]|nr:thioesterase family protein [Marinobacter sp.]
MTSIETNPFRFRFRVRYGECDAQGVVFNARYGDYVDIAVNEYIRTLFGDYQNLLDQDLDIQVVSLNQNWQAPARFDDILEARIAPGRIGNTSFSLELTFFRYGEPAPLSDATITYVMIRPSEEAKTPIPDSIRTLLEAGAPGVLISHAGEKP